MKVGEVRSIGKDLAADLTAEVFLAVIYQVPGKPNVLQISKGSIPSR